MLTAIALRDDSHAEKLEGHVVVPVKFDVDGFYALDLTSFLSTRKFSGVRGMYIAIEPVHILGNVTLLCTVASTLQQVQFECTNGVRNCAYVPLWCKLDDVLYFYTSSTGGGFLTCDMLLTNFRVKPASWKVNTL